MLKLAENTSIFRFSRVRDYLDALFAATKSLDKQCTHQAFCERLGFGQTSYTHHIISGRRRLTEKAAVTIVSSIPLRGSKKNYFLAMAKHEYTKDLREREQAFETMVELRSKTLKSDLERDQTEYFSEWYHPVIRELVALKQFREDPSWIAQTVVPSIKPKQAAQSLNLLERIGYIIRDKKSGQLRQTENRIQTPREIRSLVAIAYHQEMIGIARDSITKISSKDREIGSLTMPVTEAMFNRIKSKLQDLRSEIVAEVEDVDPASDRVVQLNVQLFPVAAGGKNSC